MTIEVKIPPMGESITSGILANWKVQSGDRVAAGQPLFDFETDKITQEGTAEATGTITLQVKAGETVPIGAVVALIETEAAAGASLPPAAEKPTPTAAGGPTVPASPAVRRLAAETGLDPAVVKGTGKGGRVTKGDMLAAAEKPTPMASVPEKSAPPPAPEAAPARPPAPPAASSPSISADPTGRVTRSKMSPLRRRIAERLVSAQQTAAILTTFNEVDMTAVMALRKKFQEQFLGRHGVKLGFMSFFVKAAIHGLREVPALNTQLDGDDLLQNNYYDVGVAVSTPRGLMVPVLREADRLSLAAIEKTIADLSHRAREGKITIADLQGGVFTISNGGIFGSMLSTPILNPPQSGILGLHTIKDRPVALDGQVVIRPIMYLALSYDHRLVDGREAVTFLLKVKEVIEDPARFLLDI